MYTIDFVICAIIFSFIYLYYLFKNIYSYFERNGIPYIRPVPFFGNTADWILMRKSLPVVHFELYKRLEPHSFAGVYMGWKKTILIRDVELVKNVLVKDFGCFRDRGIKRDPHVDILSRNLFMMRGDEWKILRIKLTSTFTSGKMKVMFPLVKECGTKLHSILEEVTDKEEFLIKDVCARFTTDVIGSCAFGLDINSLQNPDSEFRKIGNRAFSSNWKSIVRNVFPFVTRLSKSLVVDTTIQNFFIDLVRKTVEYREQHNIVRGDFLDQLIVLKNDTNLQKSQDKQGQADLDKFLDQIGEKHTKSNIEMTPELMTAQSFIFFLAGFETSSSTLSFMLLELAQNQHIQDKLRQEIITVLESHNNQLTYDILKDMKYLDMVIAETLRKYPITGNLVRECTKTYKIPDSKTILVEGTPIVISILGIHHDTKYYEKPYDFYPEHFTEEAKSLRPNYAYLPFGEGPRICIGERFAKMQIKVGAVNLLKDFVYTMSPKMKLPLEFTHGVTINDVKGGIRLRCDEWKNLRMKLTNTFTSGKMKLMFPLVKKCGTKLHSVLDEMANKEEFLIKDVCSRFTTDVIGSCAFGLEINSLQNPDSEFRKIHSRSLISNNMQSIIRQVFPFMAKVSKHLVGDTAAKNFFLDLVPKTIEYREKNKIVRGDFLDQLISLKNETDLKKLQDEEGRADLMKFLDQVGEKHTTSYIEMTPELMTAQCFIFFFAGYSTTSSTLSFMLLELAQSQNQHFQDKVRQEILTVLKNNDNQLTYDVLKEMKYLDMVIAETLRKYPIAGKLNRGCTKTYKIPDSQITLPEGTDIVISILGIHHEAKYYEKPDEFYPEHFTAEAITQRPNCAYLPFGEGPRFCIGKRFALMQLKVGAVNLLKDFSYTLSSNTKLPPEFINENVIIDIKGGIKLRCRKLQN